MNAFVLFAGAFVCMVHSLIADGGYSKGKQFMVTFMHKGIKGNNTKNFLFITSNQSGMVSVVMAGDLTSPYWKKSYIINAGNTILVYIPEQSTVQHFKTKGILVYSDVEITLYAVSEHPSSADVAVILPVTALSTYYVIPSVSSSPVIAVASVKDAVVTLDVLSSCPLNISGHEIHGTGNVTLTLTEFDVLEIPAPSSNHNKCDFGGTMVISSKPVAVFSGSSCDKSSGSCSHSMMQVVPVDMWGLRFIVPDLASRGNYQVRVVTSVDSSHIFVYEHHKDLTIHSYEMEMDRGSTRDLIVPDGTILEIFANRGIHVTQLESGLSPFSVPIPPVEDYGWNYTISTMDISQTHDYVSYINIVAHRDSTKTLTVDGNVVSTTWRRVYDLGFSVATLPLSKGNHTIEADDRFLIQVYGYNSAGSYGYTGGYYFKLLPSGNLTIATADLLTTSRAPVTSTSTTSVSSSINTTTTTSTITTSTTSASTPNITSTITATTASTSTGTHTSCRDQPGVNCAILDTSLHICKAHNIGFHYCRKYCHMC